MEEININVFSSGCFIVPVELQNRNISRNWRYFLILWNKKLLNNTLFIIRYHMTCTDYKLPLFMQPVSLYVFYIASFRYIIRRCSRSRQPNHAVDISSNNNILSGIRVVFTSFCFITVRGVILVYDSLFMNCGHY